MPKQNILTRTRKRRAHQHLLHAEYTEAKALLTRVCALDPRDAEAWYELATSNLHLHLPDEVIACCHKAIAIDAGFIDAYLLLGKALKAGGRLEEASACYQLALQYAPQHAGSYNNLGNTEIALGRTDAAIAAYRKALDIEPEHSLALSNLGTALSREGKLDEAAEYYRRALRLQPELAAAHHGLAVTLKGQGQAQAALASFLEVQRLDPGFSHIDYQIATLGGALAPPQTPPDYVKNLFDEHAQNFEHKLVDELDYRTPALLTEAALQAAGKSTTVEHVLDIADLGCGTGLCAPYLRAQAHTLTGVDLSPNMIEQARKKGLYDELFCADIVAFAEAEQARFDLIIAADVLPYFGELNPFFNACRHALRPAGVLAISVEDTTQAETYTLRASGRYAHARGYVEAIATAAGFSVMSITATTLRQEQGKAVAGSLFIFAGVARE